MSAPAIVISECLRCSGPLEPGDLRCVACALPNPARQVERAGAGATKISRCDNCGAAVRWSAEISGLQCAFCDEKMHEELAHGELVRPDAYLPFLVSREQAYTALRKWIAGRDWFAPGDLPSRARLELLRPAWWSGWSVDVEATINWTALVSRGEDVPRTPLAGRNEVRFPGVLVPGSRGLKWGECVEISGGYDLTSGEQSPRGPESAVVEAFEFPRGARRSELLEEVGRLSERLIRGEIDGEAESLNTSALLDSVRAHPLAFPVWIVVYRYRGKPFHVVINGQSMEHVAGESPASSIKEAFVFTVIALIVMAIIWMLFQG